jgi:hypothetical protein
VPAGNQRGFAYGAQNNGGGVLSATATSSCEAFAVTPVAFTVANGPQVPLGVTFAPATSGLFSCQLDVLSNGGEVHLQLSGLACFTDVDGLGAPPDVATDIVYVARTLLGLAPVPTSFRSLDPSIPSDGTIATNITATGNTLDVDGNGVIDVATDIVYIARRLLGLPPVPASFRALDPTILPDVDIKARIDALCP